jgi:hypothetical protein
LLGGPFRRIQRFQPALKLAAPAIRPAIRLGGGPRSAIR